MKVNGKFYYKDFSTKIRTRGRKLQRFCISLLLFMSVSACLSPLAFAAPGKTTENEKTILVLGDSLSAAYGFSDTLGWVALLEKKLRENPPASAYQVINASVSGETTDGGRNRLSRLLQKHKPDIVILELGANDGLRGLPLQHTRDNLEAMINAAKARTAKIVLVGMKLPPNYGSVYTNGFEQNFKDLAKKHNTALVPFLMQGIATRMELIQADGLHPTAEAQPYLLENVWPVLETLL